MVDQGAYYLGGGMGKVAQSKYRVDVVDAIGSQQEGVWLD